MAKTRGRLAAVGFTALAASQVGHFLTYWLRFGSDSFAMQAGGPHSYFPITTTAIGALGGGAAVLVLAAVGACRLLLGKGLTHQRIAGWRFVDVLPWLFIAQVGIFIGQESLESALAGLPAAPPATLFLFGALGQLPVAVLAAIVVAWLTNRFETALNTLEFALAALPTVQPQGLFVSLATAPDAVLRMLAQASPASLAKRGPPTLLLT